MFGAKLNQDVKLYIGNGNGTTASGLSGVDNVDISNVHPTNLTKTLGYNIGLTTINGPPQQELSFSRYLIYEDPMLQYTGSTHFIGELEIGAEDEGRINFKSGYLTNYSVNCAVGNVPRVSVRAVIYDPLTTGVQLDAYSSAHQTIEIPNQGSMSLTAKGVSLNRVNSFNYSVTCNRKPYYSVGSTVPSKVNLLYPLEYAATVELDLDAGNITSGNHLFKNLHNKSVDFTINGRTNNWTRTFSIPNASLVDERVNSSADGIVNLTLSYVGHNGI